jgi:hypothetical protein
MFPTSPGSYKCVETETISGYLTFSLQSSMLLIPLLRILTERVLKHASVRPTILHKTDRTGKM